jgi:hypothetical protein
MHKTYELWSGEDEKEILRLSIGDIEFQPNNIQRRLVRR